MMNLKSTAVLLVFLLFWGYLFIMFYQYIYMYISSLRHQLATRKVDGSNPAGYMNFLLSCSLASPSSQLWEAHTNEIKHDIHTTLFVHRDMFNKDGGGLHECVPALRDRQPVV